MKVSTGDTVNPTIGGTSWVERIVQSIPASYTVWYNSTDSKYYGESNIKGVADITANADITPVTQAAIDALTNGGRIHIGKCTPTLTHTLHFLNPNITFSGEGPATRFTLADGVNAESFEIGDLTHSATGTILYNFALDGNKANNTGGHGIRIHSDTWLTENCHLDNLLVENVGASGISNDSGVNCTFSNCILKGNVSSGLYMENTGKCQVSNVMASGNVNGFSTNSADTITFTGCIARSNTHYGFGLANNTGNIFSGCVARNNTWDGFRTDIAQGDVISGGFFYENGLDGIRLNACNDSIIDGVSVFENTENGINLCGADAYGLIINGATVFNNDHTGILVDDQIGISVTGSVIHTNGRDGLDVNSTLKSAFSGLSLYDNSVATANSWQNVFVRGASQENAFSSIVAVGKTTTSQQYGIYEVAPADYNTFINCHGTGTTGGISIAGANSKVNLCYNNGVWVP